MRLLKERILGRINIRVGEGFNIFHPYVTSHNPGSDEGLYFGIRRTESAQTLTLEKLFTGVDIVVNCIESYSGFLKMKTIKKPATVSNMIEFIKRYIR
jgi:hypothetical protein